MSLGSAATSVWDRIAQGELFLALADEVGPLNEKHRRFVAALDLVPVERFLCHQHHGAGRPPEDLRAVARAFIAKAVWNLPTTRNLNDRLHCDPTLRRLCGWPRVSAHASWGVPHESTFSCAFAAFANTRPLKSCFSGWSCSPGNARRCSVPVQPRSGLQEGRDAGFAGVLPATNRPQP